MDIEMRTLPDGAVLLCPSGELDLATADDLARALGAAREVCRGRPLEIDGSGVTFIDAAGLRPLLEVGDLEVHIVDPSRALRRLLDLARLDRRFG